MAGPLKVKALPPGFVIVGQALQVLLDPAKYSAAITELNEAYAAANLVVSKVGKAEEIDGMHTAATENRDEAQRLLTEAKIVAANHAITAEAAKAAIIRKASEDAAQLRTDTETHCDALRTRTQEIVNAANAKMRSDADELEDRKTEVKRHEDQLIAKQKVTAE